MTTPTRRLAVIVALGATVAVTAAVTACSSPLSSGPATTTTAPPTTTTIVGAKTPAQTKAADLRASLTYLMVEHAYLLGRVTDDIVAAPPATAPATTAPPATAPATTAPATTAAPATTGAPATIGAPVGAGGTTTLPAAGGGGGGTDAMAALDTNSHDLADLLSQAQGYGSQFAAQFYPLWTKRITDFAAYTTAKATHDPAAATAATKAVTSDATDIATLMHKTNKYIAVTTVSNPGTGLADEFGPDDQAVLTMVDAQAAHSPGAIGDLVTAAEKMPHTAEILAAAAAKLDPDQYPGTATGTAANLRAALTTVFVEHVQLASRVLDRLVRGQPDGPEVQALAGNTDQLQNIIAVNYGDNAGKTFVALWSVYLGHLEDYAKAAASGNAAAAADAAGRLTADSVAIGRFFNRHDSKLSADSVTADVSMPIKGLQAVVDAAAHGAPEVTALRVAAGSVPKLASDLAEAIAEQNPSMYMA